MFYNQMTKKFPCWKCQDREGCKIYEGIGIKPQATQNISELTFKCDKFNEIPKPETEEDNSPFPFMDKEGRWWIDEQHYKVACGCVIFKDMAGSHHSSFCKYHQAGIDESMKKYEKSYRKAFKMDGDA